MVVFLEHYTNLSKNSLNDDNIVVISIYKNILKDILKDKENKYIKETMTAFKLLFYRAL
ncbi:hypothetical protein [Campylobacter ureolyticus]|uniref:hypothetical protein n=1 Tax=Campylobacter ureolyticus TaxID=827 RepID=UPI0022B47C18|nr:hypothetical protein [Campylobacter ureolyticus]MCZ6112120.1 hypothetical protein [Campylobacter ureolyticus]MCZ6169630.1 hypothetical protein [Campylobacter ureolyticus]MDK8323851.1 hypothetical protein [Campylobacter ureolyticus]